MASRRLISVLLFVALVPLYFAVFPATGQTFTTEPTTLSTTMLVTGYSYSSFTTTYLTTQQGTAPAVVMSGISIVAVPPQYGCELDWEAFSASAGDLLTGTLSADGYFNYYLLPSNEFASFKQGGLPCEPQRKGLLPLVSGADRKSYSLNYVIRSDDTYWFVLVNYAHNVGITVSADTHLSSSPRTATVTQTQYASYPHTGEAVMTTTSLKILQVTSQAPSSLPFGIPGFPFEALVLGLLLGLAVLILKRRHKEYAS